MGLLGDIGDLTSSTIDILGGIPGGGGGGGGGSLLGSILSPQNVLLAGLAGLNYFGNKEQGDQKFESDQRQLQLLEDRFGFEKLQHADALKERALDRKFGAGKLAADIAGSQIGASVEAGKARQQAAIAKMGAIQQAYQNLVGALLQGGALSSNALGSLGQAGQRALLG